MKKILLFALCALISLTSSAQTDAGVKWEAGTLQDALNKANSNKKGAKLVFLDCYTTWCGPCKQMANNEFPKKEAGDYFNKNFVNIKIDMEKGEGIALAKKYAVAAYPTFLILNPDGTEVGRVVGGGGIAEFIKKVDVAKDIKNSPKFVKEAFEADKTKDNAMAYLKALEDSYMNAEIAKFLGENLSVFKQKDVFSQPLWKYISQNLASNDTLLAYVLENKSSANAFLGTEVVNKTIVNTYAQMLMSYLSGRKELTKEQIIEASKTINLLATSNDKSQKVSAEIALLYADKKIEEIAKMYRFMNYTSYNAFEIQPIERIFGGIKEITKEQVEAYYKEKKELYESQIKGADGWKDMFLKNKN